MITRTDPVIFGPLPSWQKRVTTPTSEPVPSSEPSNSSCSTTSPRSSLPMKSTATSPSSSTTSATASYSRINGINQQIKKPGSPLVGPRQWRKITHHYCTGPPVPTY